MGMHDQPDSVASMCVLLYNSAVHAGVHATHAARPTTNLCDLSLPVCMLTTQGIGFEPAKGGDMQRGLLRQKKQINLVNWERSGTDTVKDQSVAAECWAEHSWDVINGPKVTIKGLDPAKPWYIQKVRGSSMAPRCTAMRFTMQRWLPGCAVRACLPARP